MKKIAAVLLGLVLMMPAISFATPPMSPALMAPQILKGKPEAHPHIRAAIQELREARRELETAAHDFGGHRKEAIEAIDNAIKQLQQALEYDKR